MKKSRLEDGTCSSQSHCVDPLSSSDKPQHISVVLRRLCSQEGCDGGEWDVISQAADYIEQLENNAKAEPRRTNDHR